MTDLFTAFRRQNNHNRLSGRHKPASIVFQLQFDEQGAFIETMGSKGKVSLPDFQDYSGTVRTILKSLQLITQNQDFAINWENPSSRLYLHEHPYLVPLLLHSGCFVDAKRAAIGFHPETAVLAVAVEKTAAQQLQAHLSLRANEREWADFRFINENHAYVPSLNALVETRDVGPQFYALDLFQTTFAETDLKKYLSLLFSHINLPELTYGSYKVQYLEEPLAAQPALIFEKVDVDNSLYMRLRETVPQVAGDFLDDYDVTQMAQLNDLEKVVQVRPVRHIVLGHYLTEMEKTLKKYFSKDGEAVRHQELFVLPEAVAVPFIHRELPALLRRYIVAGAEKLRQYKVQAATPRLRLSLGSGIDFLEGSAALDFDGEEIDLFEAIQQYNKNRYVLLSDGNHAVVNDAYMNKLQRLFKKRQDGVRVSFFDLPLVEELLDEKSASAPLQLSRDIFRGFNTLGQQEVDIPKIKAKLRPYQKQGYAWLQYLHQHRLGGCLADDMGLGKTLQAITLLARVHETASPPSLVVLPRSLLFNWQQELQRFAPQLTSYAYYGADRDIEEALRHQVILTTYATVRNDIETLRQKYFCYVVLDESQNIKNGQSQSAKAVTLLQSDYRLALSGTPVENNLGELYSLFRFLNPAMFESAEHFNRDYASPIQKDNDEQAIHDLRRKIYPFILRRLKKDVLKELPDKSEQILYVEMNPAQMRFYEQRRRFYQEAIAAQVKQKGVAESQFFVFQALNELRQIACIPDVKSGGKINSPKLNLLIEQMHDLVANNRKTLIFANYLGAVEKIGDELDRAGIDFVSMTGSTRDRQALVERFQNDAQCMAFVMTLKTGGLGLNLTAADTVFIFDPWWNKAAENQAVDRAHRIGQNKKVFCYKMIAQNTIEEKILQLQEMKSELFENIVGSDNASLKSFSEEDINYILGQ